MREKERLERKKERERDLKRKKFLHFVSASKIIYIFFKREADNLINGNTNTIFAYITRVGNLFFFFFGGY